MEAKAMSQHTPKSWTVEHKPGWKTSSGMACDTGCNITAHDGQTTVTLCPLHAQAPAMREALADGVTTAAEVVARWESGDLAEAVRDLELWIKDAQRAIEGA
jgi:hypothetical protein